MFSMLPRLIATIALLCAAGLAAGRNFGVGFMLGDPTGFTAKYWTSSRTALDFGLGWTGNYWGSTNWYDDRCYRRSFRNDNPGYCRDQAYGPEYYDDDGYGWRVFHVHADYIFHNFNVIRTSEKFPLHYGPGIMLNYVDYDFAQIGVRGNFGISWLPRRVPMDVFLEIAPGFLIIPRPDFDIDACVGARFFF